MLEPAHHLINLNYLLDFFISIFHFEKGLFVLKMLFENTYGKNWVFNELLLFFKPLYSEHIYYYHLFIHQPISNLNLLFFLNMCLKFLSIFLSHDSSLLLKLLFLHQLLFFMLILIHTFSIFITEKIIVRSFLFLSWLLFF